MNPRLYRSTHVAGQRDGRPERLHRQVGGAHRLEPARRGVPQVLEAAVARDADRLDERGLPAPPGGRVRFVEVGLDLPAVRGRPAHGVVGPLAEQVGELAGEVAPERVRDERPVERCARPGGPYGVGVGVRGGRLLAVRRSDGGGEQRQDDARELRRPVERFLEQPEGFFGDVGVGRPRADGAGERPCPEQRAGGEVQRVVGVAAVAGGRRDGAVRLGGPFGVVPRVPVPGLEQDVVRSRGRGGLTGGGGRVQQLERARGAVPERGRVAEAVRRVVLGTQGRSGRLARAAGREPVRGGEDQLADQRRVPRPAVLRRVLCQGLDRVPLVDRAAVGVVPEVAR